MHAQPETRADFQDEELLMTQLAGMASSERTELGYNTNEMVLDCQFAGSNCKPRSETNSI